MASARYFLPDHPSFKEVYTRHELRSMLLAGSLSRSEIVLDDETGLAHLLGDLLAMPYPEVTAMPTRSTSGLEPKPPLSGNHEFRADTPLPQPEPARSRGPSRREEEDVDDEVELEDEDAEFEADEAWDEVEDDELEEEGEEEPETDAPPVSTANSRPGGARPAVSPASTLQYEPSDVGDDEEVDEEKKPVRSAPDGDEVSGGDPEEMLYVGHPSWFAYPRSMLAVALTIGCAFLAHHFQLGIEWPLLFGCAAGIVFLFVGLDRYTSTYFITTRRVEMEYGIIGRNTKEVRIRDIRAIDVHQAGFTALLGLGTVKFDSSASAGPEVFFKNVRRPHDIKELVRELQG